MKQIILICISLLLFSCSNKNYQKFDYNISANPWIDAFKDQVFFASLKESYQDDSIFKLMEKKDAFNTYDGLSTDAIIKARALGLQLIKNMPPPVMCENCGPGKNYYIANALHYYNSKELNEIAIAEFKKYRKAIRSIHRN